MPSAGADLRLCALGQLAVPADLAPANRAAEVQDLGDVSHLFDKALAVDFKLGEFPVAQGKGLEGEKADGLPLEAQIGHHVEVFAGGVQHGQQGVVLFDPAPAGRAPARTVLEGQRSVAHADIKPAREIIGEAVFAKGLKGRFGLGKIFDQ